MSDNWVVQHLIYTLDTCNEMMGEVWMKIPAGIALLFQQTGTAIPE